jgi:hypothetical protein
MPSFRYITPQTSDLPYCINCCRRIPKGWEESHEDWEHKVISAEEANNLKVDLAREPREK